MNVNESNATGCHDLYGYIGDYDNTVSPFLIFTSDRPTPKYVQFLGKLLPSAALGMLVIYCLKDVSLFTGNHAIPELISIMVVILLHLWKRQMLISIAGGTIFYMILIQLIF